MAANDDDNKPKLADKVIEVVGDKCRLFHDASECAYAVVQIGDAERVLPLRSPKMRSWIARTVRDELKHAVGKSTIDEALVALEGIALFDGDECPLHVRVAECEGAIIVDLGERNTAACVEVTPQGWRVLDAAPVLFRRPDAMRPLPHPERGGSMDDLRALVNTANNDAFHLLVAWLVAAYRPGRPFAILTFVGEQGSAKSTSCRVARRLVDPNAADLRSAPHKEDDLAVAALHSHVVTLDNMSGVEPWLSDALCRLATGGGVVKRKLYSDDDETVLDAIRPIILNGIDDLTSRPDLAERCVVLELQPIKNRRDEETFWREFDEVAPRILGALLDGVASALRNIGNVKLDEVPRMADFAKWIAAAEEGLGVARGTLTSAYAKNRSRVVEVALDASPVVTALRRVLDEHEGSWIGEPADLLKALRQDTPSSVLRTLAWPKTAGALGKALRRSATFLRAAGITMSLNNKEGHASRRMWQITTLTVKSPGKPSASSIRPQRPKNRGISADGSADAVVRTARGNRPRVPGKPSASSANGAGKPAQGAALGSLAPAPIAAPLAREGGRNKSIAGGTA